MSDKHAQNSALKLPRAETFAIVPWRLVVMAFLIFLVGRGGLLFATLGDLASPVWPASGVGIALLTLWGRRYWPAIVAGVMVMQVSVGVSWIPALITGMGNSLEALLGTWLLQLLPGGGKDWPGEFKGNLKLILVAIVAPAPSALIGVGAIMMTGGQQVAGMAELLLTWWSGNTAGILVFYPAVLGIRELLTELRRGNLGVIVRHAVTLGIAIAICLLTLAMPGWSSAWIALHGVLLLGMALRGYTAVRWLLVLVSLFWAARVRLFSGADIGDMNHRLLVAQLCILSLVFTGMGVSFLKSGRRMLAPASILFVGCLAVGWLVRVEETERARDDHRDFVQLARNAEAAIQQRMDTYIEVLRAGAGLINATGVPRPVEWMRFVRSVDIQHRFPDIAGIGVTLPVGFSQKGSFQEQVRSDGMPDFTVHPLPGYAHGEDLHVVTLLEPILSNRAAIGLDTGSEPVRRQAAEQARDTGQPANTGRITLVQMANSPEGLLIFVPVYAPDMPQETLQQRRASLVAWVEAPLLLDRFLAAALGHRSGKLKLHVFEREPLLKENLLHAPTGDSELPQQFELVSRVELAGRTYFFAWNRGAEFVPSTDVGLLWASDALSLATFLLVGMVIAIQSGRDTARELAKSRERDAELLRIQQLRLASVARNSSCLVMITDAASRIEWVNPGFERITGFTLTEVAGKKPGDFLQGPLTDPRVKAAMSEAVHAGRGFNEEVVNYRRDGQPYSVQIECQPLRSDEGTLVGFTAIQIDTTERNRLLQDVQRSRDRLEGLISSSPGIVWEADAETFQFTYVSEAAERLLGYPRAEWYAKGFWAAHLHPEDREQAVDFCIAETKAERQHVFEYRMVAADGSALWVRDFVNLRRENGRVVAIGGVMVDITESQQAKLALAASEDVFRTLFNHAPDSMLVISAEEADAGTIVDANALAVKQHGYSRDELLGMRVIELETPEARVDASVRLARAMANEHITFTVMCRRKNGEDFTAEVTAGLTIVRGKRRIIAHVRDISEQLGLLRKLESSEIRYRRMFENAPDGMFIISMESHDAGRIVDASEVACRARGYTREEMIGLNIARDIDVGDSAAKAGDRITRLRREGSLQFEVMHRRKDGSIFPVEVTAVVINIDGYDRILAFDRDISERKRAEEQIRQSEVRWRFALQGAGEGVWDWDVPSNRGYYSPRFIDILGYSGHEGESALHDWVGRIHPDDRAEVMAALAAHYERRSPTYVSEHRERRRDGRWIWVYARGMVMNRDADGKPRRFIGTLSDVTARRQTAQALKESELRWRYALEGAGDGVWDWDMVSGKVHYSDQWKAMLGYSVDEIEDNLSEWERLTHPDDRERALAGIRAHAEGNTAQQFVEFRMRCKDGSWKWLLARGKIIERDDGGRPLRMIGTHSDIDAMVRTRDSARLLKENLDLAVNAAKLGTIYRNLVTGEVVWNRRMREIAGLGVDDPIPEQDWLVQMAPAQEAREVEQRLRDVLRRGGRFSERIRIVRSDGRLAHLQADGECLLDEYGHPASISSVVADVTDSVVAAELLRQARANIDSIFASASEGLALISRDLMILECNPAAERMLGISRSEICNRRAEAIPLKVIREDGTDIRTDEYPCSACLRTGHAVKGVVLGIIRSDSSLVWLESNAEPVLGADGKVANVVLSFYDITDKRESERMHNRTTDRLRRALEVGRMVWWEWNMKTNSIHIDPCGAPCILGYRPDQLAGETFDTWMEKIAPDDRAEVRRTLAEVLRGDFEEWVCEYRWRGPDGSYRWLRDIGRFTLRDAAGNPVLMTGATQEIDDQRKEADRKRQLEVRLLRSQKMESLGQFAGGIAHDFNNLLTGISGNIQLAQTEIPLGSPSAAMLQVALKGCQRSRELLQRLLHFSRGMPDEAHRLIDLPRLVRDIAPLVVAALPRTVSLQLDLAPSPVIFGSDGQLMQVLLNLCVNGGQAIAEASGSVGIHTKPASLDGVEGVELSVSDTGSGMDEETQTKIFEPFFTTKREGEGTGLGLAVVQSIVNAHHGTIRVESMLGAGTRFVIWLPSRPAHWSPMVQTSLTLPKPARTANILIVDDESTMVDMLAATIAAAGHRASAHTTPQAARKAVEENPDSVDLLLTDLTMPGMSGLELIRNVRAKRPDLPVVLISGDFGRHLREIQQLPRVVPIPKPLELMELVGVINRLLTSISSPQEPPKGDRSKLKN